jgi:hypothetical protein
MPAMQDIEAPIGKYHLPPLTSRLFPDLLNFFYSRYRTHCYRLSLGFDLGPNLVKTFNDVVY